MRPTNKRLLALCAAAFSLTGCVVADMDSTNYQFPPYIQTIQKQNQQGHTDPAQRKGDLYRCGLDRSINPDSSSWRRNQLEPGETMDEHDARISRLESCMKQKGYVLLDPGSCGPLKAPTGRCN